MGDVQRPTEGASRNAILSLRCTSDEREQLAERAKSLGLTVTDLVRSRLFPTNLGAQPTTRSAPVRWKEIRYGRHG